MPTYQYRCGGCGHTYERREGFDAPSEHLCPRCGALARRLFSPPAILYKGSGFYTTDSRGKASPAPTSFGGDGQDHEKSELPPPAAAAESTATSSED